MTIDDQSALPALRLPVRRAAVSNLRPLTSRHPPPWPAGVGAAMMIEVDESWVADALQQARVARLGTIGVDGVVRMVPICFAIVAGWVVSAVDDKPKRTGMLRRLDDIETTGRATVLVDHYDDDWSRLWWIRIHGRAVVHRNREGDDEAAAALRALAAKYLQYGDRPPAGAVYRIAIDEVRSWRPPPALDQRRGA